MAAIASPMETVPFGAPDNHGFVESGIVRAYSRPSGIPFALRSLPYMTPLPFAFVGDVAVLPKY